jgi:hypothetical protein
MKLRFAALAGILLFAGFAVAASAQKATLSTASIQKWVQGFYDWYTTGALKDKNAAPSDVAIKKKSYDFSPVLLRALKEDMVASSKSPGEVVGLDFDPFLDSQDPDDHYKVGNVTKKGAHYLVEVWGVRSGKREDAVSVIAEVEQANGKFRFVNFIMPEAKDDLLHVLKQLKADRKKSGGN